MPLFKPIKYMTKKYPEGINANIEEIAAHFDKERIYPDMDYSLHTEYSYTGRRFSSELLNGLEIIKNAKRGNIPLLWFNEGWSEEFYIFIERLTYGCLAPTLIEIHPPFTDYCCDIDEFLKRYIIFEKKILELFPEVQITLENRSGTQYRKSNFLISNLNSILNLIEKMKDIKINLKIVLDVIQLFSAEIKNNNFKDEIIRKILGELKPYMDYIIGIHIWGKKISKKGRIASHVGDLNSYFNYHTHYKELFLTELYNLLDDEKVRYLVPEVNGSQKDFLSIVNDLVNTGFLFI